MAIKFKQDTIKGTVVSYWDMNYDTTPPTAITREIFVKNVEPEEIGKYYEYTENRKTYRVKVAGTARFEKTVYTLESIFKHIAIERPEGISNEDFAVMVTEYFRKVAKDI